VVSTSVAHSSLVITRAGTYPPNPTMKVIGGDYARYLPMTSTKRSRGRAEAT
jgi:hypothetical protein